MKLKGAGPAADGLNTVLDQYPRKAQRTSFCRQSIFNNWCLETLINWKKIDENYRIIRIGAREFDIQVGFAMTVPMESIPLGSNIAENIAREQVNRACSRQWSRSGLHSQASPKDPSSVFGSCDCKSTPQTRHISGGVPGFIWMTLPESHHSYCRPMLIDNEYIGEVYNWN